MLNLPRRQRLSGLGMRFGGETETEQSVRKCTKPQKELKLLPSPILSLKGEESLAGFCSLCLRVKPSPSGSSERPRRPWHAWTSLVGKIKTLSLWERVRVRARTSPHTQRPAYLLPLHEHRHNDMHILFAAHGADDAGAGRGGGL